MNVDVDANAPEMNIYDLAHVSRHVLHVSEHHLNVAATGAQ